MELTHPWFLMLVLFTPLLLLASRRSLADMTPLQRKASLLLRGLILLLLVLAPAGVRLITKSQSLSVLFVVDESASVSSEARKQARDFIAASLEKQDREDDAGVVGFAKEAVVCQAPAENLRLATQWPPPADRSDTDIGGAMAFASATFTGGKSHRLVLLSDGNDTGGSALDAAQRLAAAGVELCTVPLTNPQRPEVLVETLELPSRLKAGEPFDIVARIRSSIPTKAAVRLYQNQFLVNRLDTELQPGLNQIAFRNLRAEGNFLTYEAETLADSDTLAENNRAQATVTLRGEPRALIVDSDEDRIRPLAAALRERAISVDLRGKSGLPTALEDLQQFDLFMLSDVSALNATRSRLELYQKWVRDFGGGFVMLGGENSYGVGGYYRTPVEQMLPVRMEHEDRQDTPRVAMLIVLDRSGSMAASVQGQTKISLADQGAVLALSVLQQKDLFGLTAVDTRVQPVVPLGGIENSSLLEQKIMSITAGGGGIYIYTALADAFLQLRDVEAKIKHVILFSDAADAEEKVAGEMGDGAQSGGGSALDLAAAMLASKITTSVVALGLESDKDTAFLRELAERGSGRFYLTSDALSLPQIFSTETMKVAQSSLVEEPSMAVQAAPAPMLDGIDWKQAPLLLGYNATKPKPSAEVLLTTERGDPLLATWRYGLGQTAAFTSDAKGRWASEWLTWPGFGKFWAQVVRALMRRGEQSNFQVTTTESGNRVSLKIDAITPEGGFLNEMPIKVNVVDASGASKSAVAMQTAPGSYTASFELPALGTSLFSLSSPDLPGGEYAFGFTRSYPREFLTSETNEDLLRKIAATGNGIFAPTPAQVFARPKTASLRPVDLSNYFLMSALILLPLDIWLRRRAWRS
jgi:uncharacterized membrane protein